MAESENVEKIFVAPGNGGTAFADKCENVDITDINELLDFAKENNIDLTIVRPEDPLTKGIVDLFKEDGLKIFGPDKAGAEIEGSKSYSKDFMKKYGVKTAEYEVFYDADKALGYLENCAYPIVIKADGLAAGKGVAICETREEANTGGMGVLAPNPYVTEEVQKEFEENIMAKTLAGIQAEGYDFKGIIFFGLMITKKGTYLLEYNVRMGDPETQSVLYLMESDLLEVIEADMNEDLAKLEIKWNKGTCVNVVLDSKGYPTAFTKGYEITIKGEVKDKVFLSGAIAENGVLNTNGGRVLSVIGVGGTIEEAYKNIDGVEFEGMYFRNDIGVV
ncbi:phosphoribosylamine--glycine ligase [Clostridium gasigenes]|uniref:phosphoribosylamine--glycine ligase n=1 Tax=Clostridium gasigenes TaxID=94869 RepID=UPI001A9BDBD3|nr:phosphoribosylglycinamide synthetase C domain-containing protein [Clostridium gasigenes]